MYGRVLSINRPMERLLTTVEVADRLNISYTAALDFMRAHGVRLSGKAQGRLYITESELHRLLKRNDSGRF